MPMPDRSAFSSSTTRVDSDGTAAISRSPAEDGSCGGRGSAEDLDGWTINRIMFPIIIVSGHVRRRRLAIATQSLKSHRPSTHVVSLYLDS